MPTAVVTGASGFLGSAFARELRARGYGVTGIDLEPGPDVVVGDVGRAGPWTAAFTDADLVVHAAAVVREFGDEATFFRVNVGGTRNVLEAAAVGGASRVLHLSSIVVYGSDFPDLVDESAPVRMTGNPYTDTKVAAEHAALAVAASRDLALTVIRPGDVYGPGSRPWVLRIIDLLRRGLFVLPDGGRGIVTPTHVDDVVSAGLAAATSPDGVGEIFNVTGGRGVTVADYVRPFADALGVTPRSVPRPVATAATTAIAAAYRAAGKTPPVAPAALEYVTHPGTYSIAKIRQVLGWEPAVDLSQGIRETCEWARREGLLPPDGDGGRAESRLK